MWDLSMEIEERKAVKKFMNMSNNESITGKLAYLPNLNFLHVFLSFSSYTPQLILHTHLPHPSRWKKFYVRKLELELLEEGLDLILPLSPLKNTHSLAISLGWAPLVACAKLFTGKMVIFFLLQLFLILSFHTRWSRKFLRFFSNFWSENSTDANL